jgi:tRNA threonylcarbamoyl adenosine modification protein (Sua5/YciO/YrdC/YwlC family)
VVGFPTDTVYGIGVDPTNDEAVSVLYELKGRPQGRPVGILAATLEQAAMIGDIGGVAAELASRHWPGALTLVVRPRVILAAWVGDRMTDTVGLRVPDHPLALELLTTTGPLAVTSANPSGGQETLSDVEAREVFGPAVHYLAGTSPGGEASTVVDVTGARPVVIREGPVVVQGG